MTPHARNHTFRGDVRPGLPTGSGYHYRPGGQDFPGRRIVPGTRRTDTATGAYVARPEYFDPTIPPNGAWKPKGGNQGVSSFFPDHWTPAQVDAAIPGAFRHAIPIPGTNRWTGTYGGITIEGYYNNAGGFAHGWPVVNP